MFDRSYLERALRMCEEEDEYEIADQLYEQYASEGWHGSWIDYYEARKNGNMSDWNKKHWLTNGSKFETYEAAEVEAKKRTSKSQTETNIYMFVAQATPVIPDINVTKIV